MQPHGISILENVIKEAQEEAGVERVLAEKAVPAGAVSYTSQGPGGIGIKRDVLFVFDLELPESFVPEPRDGEVEAFELLPAEKVLETVAFTDEYKDNCNLVLVDFFVRHGLIPADALGYLDLVSGLRSSDCS
jgi:8-oxo-dGTP pyrophosphatase MutT (NUDIX family)